MCEVTKLDTEDGVVYVCDNCGAHAFDKPEDIVHAKTCKPGECRWWEKYYNEQEEGDNLDMF
jgi:hypothetical protein